MTRRAHTRLARALVPALALLLALAAVPAHADEAPTCDGPFNGRPVPAAALTSLMERHRVWLEDFRPVLLESIHLMSQFRDVVSTVDSAAFLKAMADPRRANLCGADLSRADLAGADLAGADLTGADLVDADLTGADLTGADVTGADLTGAALSRADLTGTDLTGARLGHANLFGTVFEPRLTGLDPFREGEPASLPPAGEGHHAIGFPDLDAMAQARNLDRMVFVTSPTPLQRLRDAFAARGHRAPARQVMASLQWAADLKQVRDGAPTDRVGGALRVVLLGITCSYGAAPGRAVGWLLCLVLAFAIPHARLIARGGGDAGPRPGAIRDYALAGALPGLALVLLAPWLVLNPGAAWFRHLGFGGTFAPGAWAVALFVVAPLVYLACAALLAAAGAVRARLHPGPPATLPTLVISALLIAGLVSIPGLALVTGSSGQPGAVGGPVAFVAAWMLLLLALMHTAGTYAQGRDGAIIARWETDGEERPPEVADPAFFQARDMGAPAAGDAAPTRGLPAFLYVARGALWFSLIISFRIGSKDLSLGTWLTHMQPRPYNLVPTGGLRVICGFQSLVGSYLLALLLLTYFRPLFSL